jgi:phospholipid/cholesterol/gamma-HCH transport system ATP-binding protein
VLEDITFDCRKGRITAILGPSGTGKSVLLKNILGLLRKKFGVLFQYGALFGSMISTTTSHSPLREHTRKNEAAIRELVHRNAELVGLMDHLKKLPGEVSGA